MTILEVAQLLGGFSTVVMLPLIGLVWSQNQRRIDDIEKRARDGLDDMKRSHSENLTELRTTHSRCKQDDEESHRRLYTRLGNLDAIAATIPHMDRRLDRVESNLGSQGERIAEIHAAVGAKYSQRAGAEI